MAVQRRAAYAGSSAHQGTGQDEGDDLPGLALLLGRLTGLLVELVLRLAAGGRICVITKAAAVTVILTVIEIEFIHDEISPFKGRSSDVPFVYCGNHSA